MTQTPHFFLKGVANFRDIGGYPAENGMRTKKGLVYRSGNLSQATDEDMQALRALGIRTVFDLRTHKEKEKRPDRGWGADMRHFPVGIRKQKSSPVFRKLFSFIFGKNPDSDFDRFLISANRQYVSFFSSEFSEVLRLLSTPGNLPVLIHCTGGKDRTGFACAMLQLLLGVPREHVFEEYLLSNDAMREFREDLLDRYEFLAQFHMPGQKISPALQARKEHLASAFRQMKKEYGGVAQYLEKGLTLSQEERQQLRAIFLEPSTGR